MSIALSRNAKVMAGEGNTEMSVLTGWTLEMGRAEVDVTAIGDANKKYMAGARDAKGTFEMLCDPDNASYTAIFDAQKKGEAIPLTFRLNGTGAGKPQVKVSAYITAYSVTGAVDDKISVSAGWAAAGDMDFTAQPAA
jgi:hypothetical protein